MTYLNPNKWMIVNYRPGTGGKFLCLALTTIEKIAHWNPDVEFQNLSWENYIKNLWNPDNKELWLASEPITCWDLTFFSRTMPRGEELSLSEFDDLCQIQSSQYFKEIWESDKIILDFLNKKVVPDWWKQSKIIKLDANINDPGFKKRLLKKIYIWDEVTKMGHTMMDKPMPEQKYQNAAFFKNKWKHGPFSSKEEWIDWVVENDTRVNFTISNPDIVMHDLLDFQKIYFFLKEIANSIGSTVDYEKLKVLHEYWITRY
jgi:hypothetical protein